MRPALVVNDLHLGVQRIAGTTPETQVQLREYLQSAFRQLIEQHMNKDLIINGDLFDGFTVDIADVLECYSTLADWLDTLRNGRRLILVAGNHDIGKRNDRYSSFDVLCKILTSRFPDRVEVVNTCLRSFDNLHIIPHCMNQDLFDIEMAKALDLEPGFLLLHANIDNGFAENSDHSLNVSAEWLERLSKKHTLMFAHEHQGREHPSRCNRILVMGNQWPSSVSDCRPAREGQRDGFKFAHVIHRNGDIERIKTWDAQGDFQTLPWDQLEDTDARFIRITGNEPSERASDVISAIAKFRKKSNAFVIANGVKIEGISGLDSITEDSFQSVKSFDVLAALLEQLDEKEQAVVKMLLGETP